MAAPTKNTVDYFPHLIGRGKKMDYIEKKYGNDGYATWYKILENLASSDNHFIDLNDEIEFSFLAMRCNLSEERLKFIINDLVFLKVFDKILWENGVIWSKIFYDSIQDAYKRRNNKAMQYVDILNVYGIKCKQEPQLSLVNVDINRVNVDINQQSKVNEIKEEKKKKEEERKTAENPSIQPSENLDFIQQNEKIKIESCILILKSRRFETWRNFVCMQQEITVDQMFDLFDKFGDHLKLQNQFEKSTKDFQTHFLNLLKKGWGKEKPKQTNGGALGEGDLFILSDDPTTPPNMKGDWMYTNKRWLNLAKVNPLKRKQIIHQYKNQEIIKIR